VPQALDQLREAFECESAALYALAPSGRIELWCARGPWNGAPGDLRPCVSVPLLRGPERVGTLDLRGRPGQRLRPAQIGLIRTAAGALGAALGARLELERLRHQPGRDVVTGLSDAKGFHARLKEELVRATRHAVPLAVVTLDLDHFAGLNSRYGREVGDAVLAEAAVLLKLTLRESDVLARVGSDQFAAILPETDLAAGMRCAERLCRALEEHRFPRVSAVSASAGVAASPRHGLELPELMEHMDRALGIAKKSGRRRVAVPEPGRSH
jgi:diguanylate cyclase (GGDEF)-like protein